MTHLRSLRDYIAALDEIGEIQRVDTEVDWNLEMGAVIRRSHDLRAPAILPVVAAGPPVEEDHTVTGTMHAAEILCKLRQAGLPAALAWVCAESAFHWLIVAVRSDWPEAFGGHSGEHGWPGSIRQRVLDNWHAYGYR